MRDRWYGDNRDLIKWGGIKILCKDKGINKIFWVAYLREDCWTDIKFDDNIIPVPVPDEVIRHFKSIRQNMSQLRETLDLDIILVDDEIGEKYSHQNRVKYTKLICEYIKNNADVNKVVFLDPDTGLEPNRLEETHVSKDEIKQIWKPLKVGDYLVFYQHKFWPTTGNWKDIRKDQFANCCNNENDVKMWCADDFPTNNDFAKLASDVVFYFIKKKDLSA